jgi:membrane protein required for colicin V production
MNWVDFAIVIIIALTGFSSLLAGVIRQAMTLLGLAVGVYAALGNYQRLASRIVTAVANQTLASVVAFLLILLVAWVGAAFLAKVVRNAFNTLGLGWADNFLGMLTGVLVGLLVVVGLLLLMVRLPVPALAQAVQQSTLASYVFMLLPYLKQLLPSDLHIFKTI